MSDERAPVPTAEGRLRSLLEELSRCVLPGWSPGWSDGEVSVTSRNRNAGRFSITWLEGFNRFAAAFRPLGASEWKSRSEFEPGPGTATAIAAWMEREAREA
ncbi:MAG: hypothetical protein AAB074_20850 [Planctomycetota bacterium]